MSVGATFGHLLLAHSYDEIICHYHAQCSLTMAPYWGIDLIKHIWYFDFYHSNLAFCLRGFIIVYISTPLRTEINLG